MLLFWFSSEKKAARGIGFVEKAMGCLFGCFGIKHSRPKVSSPPEPAFSKNALSSLFLSDEDESPLKKKEGRNPVLRELDVKELKDEQLKFAKSYKTPLEASTEFQNDLEKWKDIHAQNREEKSLKLSSWFANASTDRLEKQSEEPPMAVKIYEECVTDLGSLAESPSSCMTERHITRSFSSSTGKKYDVLDTVTPNAMCESETRSETSSVSPLPFAPCVKSTIRSVHFVHESDRSAFSSEGSSSECASQHLKRSGLASKTIVTEPCPYPTTLKFTEEMQTPGSEFPAYMDGVASGIFRKDRSDHAYSVSNPVENSSQWRTLNDGRSSSDHMLESLKPSDEESLLATPTVGPPLKHHSAGKETESEGSLSSWFKPVSVKQGGNKKTFSSVSVEKVTKTPGDRPILGMVAAYWNDDGTSQTSPKWWDGNGIPNSTNKYKEDQKVSWHATPFEERLEKALSAETSISQRKPIGSAPPVDFNGAEESDTAISRLQSSNHAKPVVSF